MGTGRASLVISIKGSDEHGEIIFEICKNVFKWNTLKVCIFMCLIMSFSSDFTDEALWPVPFQNSF
jgi:hypothetical protein